MYLMKILSSSNKMQHFTSIQEPWWQVLYGLGVRRIGVTTLPPAGCLPAAITLFGAGSNQCVARLNKDAMSFNNKLNRTAQGLKSTLPGLKLVVFDIYHPLLDLIVSPVNNGNLQLLDVDYHASSINISIIKYQITMHPASISAL